MYRSHRVPGVTAPLLLAVMAGLGCVAGSGDEAPADNAAAAPQEMVVHTTDYAFDAPDTVQSGPTTVRLVNDGPSLHHVQLFRLDEGKTLDDFKQALAAPPGSHPPEWMVEVGGPNPPPPGGGEFATTLDLEPGNYAMICFVPDSADVPHFVHGMMQGLTVVPASAEGEMPEADAVMTLYDYGFRMDQPIASGPQQIRVMNEAAQPHEVWILKLNPGGTEKDFLNWMAAPEGPLPGTAVGGVAAISPGQENIMALDLEPGNYALYCFVPDPSDGKPHLMHGMATMITVT